MREICKYCGREHLGPAHDAMCKRDFVLMNLTPRQREDLIGAGFKNEPDSWLQEEYERERELAKPR